MRTARFLLGVTLALVAVEGWSVDNLLGPVALREPPNLSSHAGVLAVTLTAQRSTIDIGGQKAVTAVYDGSYIPPTLRVHPGDVMATIEVAPRLGGAAAD